MLHTLRRRTVNPSDVLKRAARACAFEGLENRQLLSVTIDLRLPGGGKQAAATSVGQVIAMEAWATVSGSNGSADEGFQLATGSLVSADLNGGSVSGTLRVTRAFPFTGAGSQDGAQQDLDGDGDLDVGSANSSALTNYVFARADVMQSGSSFKFADLSFTVTGLKGGQETDVIFVSRPTKPGPLFSYATGVWREDGAIKSTLSADSNASAGLFNGSGVFLTRSGSGGTGGGTWGGGGPTSPPPPPPPPPPSSAGSIAGSVFKDNNSNGTWDNGEPGFGGFQLYIDSNLNGAKDGSEPTTWADGNGNYKFSNLAPNNTYRVRAFPPGGWGTSFPGPNRWHDVFVGSGQNITGKHFGERPLTGPTVTPGSISGSVFKDNNSNGTWDNGEPAFGGFQLYIDSNLNGVMDSNEPTTWADGNGNYKFSNLPANNNYRVRAMPPSGWGTSFPSPNRWHDLFVASGQNITGKHFGERPLNTSSVGSISGRVFKDTNSNGFWDGGESVFAGFQLYIDSNYNGVKDASEATTWTDGNGNYSFGNLSPNNSYRVRAFPPSGWGTSSPGPNRWYDVWIANGQNVTGMNFGERPL